MKKMNTKNFVAITMAMIMIMAVSVPAVVAQPCPPCPNPILPVGCDKNYFYEIEPCLECPEWFALMGNSDFVLLMIDNKDGNWNPIDGCPFGYVGYINQGDTLELVVEFWGLTPNQEHQICLNGPGVCTPVDHALASGVYDGGPGPVPPDTYTLFERGYWAGGPYLSATCNDPGQGIYNIGMDVMTDSAGHYCGYYDVELPPGYYDDIKFLVKECTAPGGCSDTNGQWIVRLMECEVMAFDIGGGTGTEVGNVAPVIQDMWIEQNGQVVGDVILNPCPETTTITVYEKIFDANGIDDIASVVISSTSLGGCIESQTEFEIDSVCDPDCCCAIYAADIELDCCCPANDYYIENTVTDNGGLEDTETEEFAILGMMYIEITPSRINFGDTVPDVEKIVNVVIHNKGNQPTKITVAATPMICVTPATCDAKSIPASALDVNGDYGLAPPGKCIKDDSGNEIEFACCIETTVPFSIRVPLGTPSGSYRGTICFTPGC